MTKHLLILALALAVALIAALGLVLHARSSQPEPPQPQVYCLLPQPQFSKYHCTLIDSIPVYQPQPGKPDAPGGWNPLPDHSGICRSEGIAGLVDGTLAFCPGTHH